MSKSSIDVRGFIDFEDLKFINRDLNDRTLRAFINISRRILQKWVQEKLFKNN